jgi:hypothetical protein
MSIWPWSRIRALEAMNADLQRMVGSGLNSRLLLGASNARLQSQLDAKTTRLERIAALETPRCAHVGKRMAKIARGEG